MELSTNLRLCLKLLKMLLYFIWVGSTFKLTFVSFSPKHHMNVTRQRPLKNLLIQFYCDD